MDELICPRCGTRMRYNAQHEKIMCPQCQYAPFDARQAEVKARGPRPGVKISHRGQINRNARAAYNSGHHYLHEGQPEKALESFKRAIFFQPDFTDAHIAIADLVDDEQTKRDHLGVVIAFDGSNLEAVRRLMVLDGRLTAEEAARTYHYDDQQVEHIDLVETKKAEVLLCPVCGGQLTVNDENGQVECKYCGYVEVRTPSYLRSRRRHRRAS